MSSNLIKKSAGELLVKDIEKAMIDRDLSMDAVAKKTKIGLTTLYRYFKKPGSCSIERLGLIARAVGIKEVVIYSGGTYYAK